MNPKDRIRLCDVALANIDRSSFDVCAAAAIDGQCKAVRRAFAEADTEGKAVILDGIRGLAKADVAAGVEDDTENF